eukprot:TRINITY_DN38217_c0_g1_i1.p1 TRINITY_DN38217_c0_g1~~TRINITY_DN38217_c0_g1_i1.p1  ORF type:complete len:209 (+),score=51.47 TRINITY_DN38217_c0_g1_i1:38-628(+)
MGRIDEAAVLSRATELKERGNKRLAAKDGTGALRNYTEGLQELQCLLGEDRGTPCSEAQKLATALHSNAAQALMKQRRWLEAIDRCHSALRWDPSHAKSSWRGASCAIEVGMHDVAVAFVEKGLLECPDCMELLQLQRQLGTLPEPPAPLPPGGGSDDEDICPSDFRLPSEAEKAEKAAAQPRRAPPPKPGKEKGD